MQGHKSETTLEPQGILLGLTEFKQYSFLHSNKLLIIQCTDVHCFDTIKGTGIRHFNSPSVPNTVIPRNQGIFFFLDQSIETEFNNILLPHQWKNNGFLLSNLHHLGFIRQSLHFKFSKMLYHPQTSISMFSLPLFHFSWNTPFTMV